MYKKRPLEKQKSLSITNVLTIQRYIIESNKTPNLCEYLKLCRVCLEEEDSVLYRMYECPPVQYMADVVTHAIQAHYNISITKDTKNYSPSDQPSPAFVRKQTKKLSSHKELQQDQPTQSQQQKGSYGFMRHVSLPHNKYASCFPKTNRTLLQRLCRTRPNQRYNPSSKWTNEKKLN